MRCAASPEGTRVDIFNNHEFKITFNEAERCFTISTPGGTSLKISDQQPAWVMQDSNGNTISSSNTGIAITSRTDLTIKADGNISLDATADIALNAAGNVSLNGLNITQTAQVAFTAKAAATAELSASGQTVVKGALVMIN